MSWDERFKSGQWRICAQCLSSIAPKDWVHILYEEQVCVDCANAEDELEKGYEELARLNKEEQEQ